MPAILPDAGVHAPPVTRCRLVATVRLVTSTPRPNARQAAFLVERIEDVYPGVRPERIIEWSIDVCRALRSEGRHSAVDLDHLEAMVRRDARPGAHDDDTLEEWVQHLFSGSGPPRPTFEQAEAILQIVRDSGFCRLDDS